MFLGGSINVGVAPVSVDFFRPVIAPVLSTTGTSESRRVAAVLITHRVVSAEVSSGSSQSGVASTKVTPAPSWLRSLDSERYVPVTVHSISSVVNPEEENVAGTVAASPQTL